MRQRKVGRKPVLTAAKRRKAIILRERGFSVRRIATELKCSTRTIERALKSAPKLPPAVADATPAAVAAVESSAPLIEKVRALYAAIQAQRADLPPGSDVGAKLAVDAVDCGGLLGRLEGREKQRGKRLSRDQIDACLRSMTEKFRALARKAGRIACSECQRELSVEIPDPPPTWRPVAAQAPDPADAEDEQDAELSRSLDEYFDGLRQLAGQAADAAARQRYFRQAGRLAGLLARLQRHAEDEVSFDAETVARGEAFVTGQLAVHLARPLMCAQCSRELSIAWGNESPAPEEG